MTGSSGRPGRRRPATRSRRREESPPPPLVLNDYTFLAWPAFDARWTALLAAVAKQRAENAAQTPATPEATMLSALVRVIRDHIARDPNARAYRLRGSLGAWRRIKFLGRFRLYYRFSSSAKVVILAWLNDENTLRKEGAATDPYVVFTQMLRRGDIPSDWDSLVAGSRGMTAPLPGEHK